MNKNSEFTSQMVDNFADKLLIGLTKEENNMVLEELTSIDEDFQMFEKIDGLDKVEPMSWCLDRTIDNLREDIAEESTDIDLLLSNCDETNDCDVEVPKVVSE